MSAARRSISIFTTLVVVLLVIVAPPAAGSHTTLDNHTTDTAFSNGSFEGNVSVDGSGDGAELVLETSENITATYSFTGSEQTFTVPQNVDNMTVELWGAGGGAGGGAGSGASGTGGAGGAGAYVKSTVQTTPGDTVYVYVGGAGGDGEDGDGNGGTTQSGGAAGFNGGGVGGNASGSDFGAGGGGGGMSDIRTGGNSISDRVLAAGGGAGGAGADFDDNGANGGDGQASSISGTGSYEGGDGADVGSAGGGGGGGSGNNGGTGGGSNEAGDGGGSLVTGTNTKSTTGGGNSGDGKVTITYTTATVSTYISANYSVAEPTQGYVNFSENTDANATVTWEGWDGNQWQTLNTTTGLTQIQNVTFPFSNTAGVSKARVNITSTHVSGQSSSLLKVESEGVEYNVSAPTVDNSSAAPANDKQLQSAQQTFEIDINDSDFGKSHGDSVTVSLFVNESADDSPQQVGTDTLTTNRTASISHEITSGGNVTWFVWANDSYGHSQRSDTFNVTAPSQLRIVNEENHTQLIDNAEVNLIFYFDGEPVIIEERNTTDGTINMAGLPANRPFVVAAQADNYYTRRIYLENLFEQQEIYLLNQTVSATQTTFSLRDFTGQFPAATTVLKVQRAINESWRTVEGDFFGGANEFDAQLRFNVRHRLVVLNTETGEQRTFNALWSATSGEKVITLTTGDPQIKDLGVTVGFTPQTGQVIAGEQRFSATFRNGTKTFDSYSVRVYLNDSGARSLEATRSGTVDGGETFTVDLNLTQNASERVEINATYTLADGTTVTRWRNYSVAQSYTESGLLDVLATVPGRIGTDSSAITTLLSFAISLLVSIAATRRLILSTETAGLVMTALLAGFFLLGWLPVNLLFVAGMAWVVAAAIRRGL